MNFVQPDLQPELPARHPRESGFTQERKTNREKLKERKIEYKGLIFSRDGQIEERRDGENPDSNGEKPIEESMQEYLQLARKEGINPMEVAENGLSNNGSGVKKRGQWFNACEVFRPIPPTEWLVEGLVSKGSVSLIVGEGGSKKTYSMIDLSVCLAMGNPWLNFPTTQAGVLWVDEESGVVRMKRRLKQAMNAHQAPPETPVDCVCMANFNLRNPEDINQLFAEVWSREVGLVVIDALADVMPGGDENAVRDVVPVFQGLRKIAEFTGAAVVVIHHANKSGGYRGSSHIRGAVELMLMAQSKEISTFIDFQSIKTRDTPSLHFAAQIHFELDDPRAERVWLTSADSADAQRANRSGDSVGSAGQYVLGFLSENGESGISEITVTLSCSITRLARIPRA